MTNKALDAIAKSTAVKSASDFALLTPPWPLAEDYGDSVIALVRAIDERLDREKEDAKAVAQRKKDEEQAARERQVKEKKARREERRLKKAKEERDKGRKRRADWEIKQAEAERLGKRLRGRAPKIIPPSPPTSCLTPFPMDMDIPSAAAEAGPSNTFHAPSPLRPAPSPMDICSPHTSRFVHSSARPCTPLHESAHVSSPTLVDCSMDDAVPSREENRLPGTAQAPTSRKRAPSTSSHVTSTGSTRRRTS